MAAKPHHDHSGDTLTEQRADEQADKPAWRKRPKKNKQTLADLPQVTRRTPPGFIRARLPKPPDTGELRPGRRRRKQLRRRLWEEYSEDDADYLTEAQLRAELQRRLNESEWRGHRKRLLETIVNLRYDYD